QAAGYTVKKQLNLGDEKTALKAIEGGTIDAYPEYTGTALLSFFGYKSNALPKNPLVAYADEKKGFAKKGLVAISVTPFTSSNERQIKRDNEVLLQDDKGMFPPYNSTLVVRKQIADKGGKPLADLIGKVNAGLTAQAMQELNARVDLDKKTPQVVAGEYLSETG